MIFRAQSGFEAQRLFGPAARQSRVEGPAKGGNDPVKVASEFAGIFYKMMLDEMQKTVPANEFFGSRGEEVFRSLWVDELGRRMAERSGDPLTAAILKEMGGQHGAATNGETL